MAIAETLKKYISLKINQNQEMIWFCTVNNHGKFLAILLIDYGSEETNVFFVNVAVATSIYRQSLIKQTNEFLKTLQIIPEAYMQDGENIQYDSTVTIQSCSRILFSTLKTCDIHDKKYDKYYTSSNVFSAALEEVPQMNKTIQMNDLVNQPIGRHHDIKFNQNVFSNNSVLKLITKIAKYSSKNRFEEIRKYILTLLDAFKIMWDRQGLTEST